MTRLSTKLPAKMIRQAAELDLLAEALEGLAGELLTSPELASKATAGGSSLVAVMSEHLLVAVRFRECAGTLRELARATFREGVRQRKVDA